MEAKETLILQKVIESWISNNLNKVLVAQDLAKKILEYGFIDPSKTLPFQILPTDISDSNGDLICKLFVNLENPIYGFFTIEISEDDLLGVTCPNTWHSSYYVTSVEDCHYWLDTLDQEMNTFYELSSAAEEKQTSFCNLKLNEMLENYKKLTETNLIEVKDYISQDERIAIVSNSVYALAKDAQRDFSKALLLPQAWAVFESIDDLPDFDEEINDYLDEKATNKLFDRLVYFAQTENYYAAPIYLAQRICLQAGMDVRGFSKSEDTWVVAAITEEYGEFVLPPIDISSFEVK